MATTLTVSDEFREKLAESHYRVITDRALEQGQAFYGDETRGCPFFPEYTGHRVEHVQGVLNANSWLQRKSAAHIVSPNDIAILTCATLLHDAAMLLTEDGFLTLVSDDAPPHIPDLDHRSWPTEWEAFRSEASRWDDRKLNEVFARPNDSPVVEDLSRYIRFDDFDDPESWTLGNRRFIGEFVRRHHARLAHEFAFLGIPGVRNVPRFQMIDGDRDFRDLCGLVARSHNMDLRATFPYLKRYFHTRTTAIDAHPIFLMVVLRIADFLQVESSRAPASSLVLRSLRNAISQMEWQLHHAIAEVRTDEDDDEAIFIRAKPTSARSFRRLQSRLNSLQTELDHSWAVLGEVYSTKSELRDLGIRLRRVKSNLDDISEFAKHVNYVPDHFSICTAGTSLLRKLVGPLYGERPVVGIRELMQNSIDAVRERHAIKKTPYESSPEIAVRLLSQGDQFSLNVCDQGVGMTADIVRDYFLTVGASFRDSGMWQSTFKKTLTPDVIRSGRYGVGVLAAFLIGPRISVVTRHHRASDREALSFVASIDDDEIEVNRTVRDAPGTSISIEITQDTYESLRRSAGEDWDWYRWILPVVSREIDEKRATNLIRVAMPNTDLEPEWHRLATSDYEEVLWTYGRTPRLLVNGIVVGSEGSSRGYSRKFEWEGDVKTLDVSNPLQVPYVSITDRKGDCPLDLQRFGIALHRFSFRESLMTAAAQDFVAFLLLTAPTAIPEFSDINALRSVIQYPGRESNRIASFAPVVDYGFTTEGIVPLHWANLIGYSPSWTSVVLSFVQDAQFPQFPLRAQEMVCFATLGHTPAWEMMLPTAISNLLGRENAATGPHSYFFTRNESARLLIPEQIAEMLLRGVNGQLDFSRVEQSIVPLEASPGQDVPLTTWNVGKRTSGLTQDRADDLREVISAVLSHGCIFAELSRPSVHINMQNNVFAQIWRELIPDSVIPYDVQTRKSKFAETYRKVDQYLQKWEAILSEADWRKRFWRNNYSNERL